MKNVGYIFVSLFTPILLIVALLLLSIEEMLNDIKRFFSKIHNLYIKIKGDN